MNIDYTKHFCGEDGYCLDYEKAEIVILPVPYDGTSTWIKGADRGPAALLAASPNLEFYDIVTDSEVYKHGIATHAPLELPDEPEKMIEVVRQATEVTHDKKQFPVTGNYLAHFNAKTIHLVIKQNF